MSKPFSAGGVLQLPKNRYGVALTWNRSKSSVDLDLQALVIDQTGAIIDAVFYNKLEAIGRALAHTGDDAQKDSKIHEETVWVNLNKVGKHVKLILFMVACHGGGSLGQASDAKVTLVEQWQGQTKETIPVGQSGGIRVMLIMNRGDDDKWTIVKAPGHGVEGNHFMDILEPIVGEIIRRRIKGAPKKQHMKFKMKKGSVQDLPNQNKVKRIAVGVGWNMGSTSVDLDVSAVLFGDVGQKIGAVFYNNTSAWGLQHTGDNETGEGDGDDETIMVNLDQVPQNVHQIFFIVNVYTKAYTFNMLHDAYCRVAGESGDEMLRYDFTPSSSSGSGLILARMFRNHTCKRWGFQAVGTFCEGRKWMDRSCLKEMQRVYFIAPEQLEAVPDVAPVSPRGPRDVTTPRKTGSQARASRRIFAESKTESTGTYFFGGATAGATAASGWERIRVGIGWDILQNKQGNKVSVDLDVAAVFFHHEGRDVGAVDYENVEEFGVKHSGDNTTGEGEGDDEIIDVNLMAVPPEISQIFLIVTVFTKGMSFSKVENAYCRVCDEDGEELVRHDLSNFDDNTFRTGLVIAQIFRRPDLGWFFKKRSSFLDARTWLDPASMIEMRKLFTELSKGPEPEASSPPLSARGTLLRGASYINGTILGQRVGEIMKAEDLPNKQQPEGTRYTRIMSL